ncbi:coiled-coil domain-containing protein MTMR15 [Pyricularia oryzae 70-15]|uniref:Fanconi-associated nuclease n=3 Tax=Pyricularia oryzae TaxID=318829 RepID=G4NCQ4_PYRO7|nr:coiled-coil domain-containing protein MTMR15 [Pyricularia oryzae 70-15]EHA49148.1 coiled-coil domain-containing protein MTMR15 [Pyricularia oryzae 70-15]ELQ37243.1 coiled-coil domain-containing protein MTMR15 [Pyricularia oryzae Y34]KAI7922028.1 coiled-coil domain-containing protein MTMR15 [Pyricularia oryzae]KAI7924274.1 coiled-coil domain-containing protein MTMR15 [Pyricularia oryzae]
MNAFVKRIPRSSTSASNHSNGTPERPAKRVKVQQSSTAAPDDRDGSPITEDEDHEDDSPRKGSAANGGELKARPTSPEPDPDQGKTPFESSLPPIKTEQDAIEEYEAFRASQQSEEPETAASRLENRNWVRGRSSIYVDAFNLALETVIEDESDLFDENEMAVFDAWKALDYEAQYLYVRLFLRKTAAWHRSDRLGYYSDILDPDAAIASLQETRKLPCGENEDPCPSGQPIIPLQVWSLTGSFTFANSSEDTIDTVQEALSLLSLDELKTLAKEAKVKGGNKAQIQKALCLMSTQQVSLMSVGLRRSNTTDSTGLVDSPNEQSDFNTPEEGTPVPEEKRGARFLDKVLGIAGPCIRLSPLVFKLFERVHLMFYRSTEWTEKSLTTIILSKISKRNFPEYIVCRSTNIFLSRHSLLEFEQAMRMEFEIDKILESGPPGEEGFRKVLALFGDIEQRWGELLQEEQLKEDSVYDTGEGCYLRRFSAGHAFTRIAHKAAYVHGRLHRHAEEHSLLSRLLEQRLFHLARRGAWYQRKALLEENYMADLDVEHAGGTDPEQRKKHWRRIAVMTCEQALEDNDCHLIYHYDLQKRLVKLEKKLRIPKRLQHDFGHVRLQSPEEHTVSGIQVKRDDSGPGKSGRGPSTKTIWLDEHEDGEECSVEEMCLSHYRTEGWKGYHAEGGIIRTLFAYLFYDILFLYLPNVFQTAYQTCPLDLHTDAFYPARASEINHRLVEIANGGAASILRAVDSAHRERRTCVVGLNWDFALEDLVELVDCFRGEALAAICRVMAQEYRQRGGGIPDLVLWRTEPRPEVMFAEVKSANDRLSDTQRLWIHVLTGAGVRVALTAAVAKEVREG